MSNNLLTASPSEAKRMLAERRKARYESEAERRTLEAEVFEKYKKQAKVFRALLKSGHKDSLFSGFNGDADKWTEVATREPDDWIWVTAKSGIMGVPYPDGSEYSFPPRQVFPLHVSFQEYVHETMKGEVREI
jgi:hypothetical protein